MSRARRRIARMEARAGATEGPRPEEVGLAMRRGSIRATETVREIVDTRLGRPEPLYGRLTDQINREREKIGFRTDSADLKAHDAQILERVSAGAERFSDARGELIRRLRLAAERLQGCQIDPDRESTATLLAVALFGSKG